MAISSRTLARAAALLAVLAAAGANAASPARPDSPRLSAGRPGLIVDAPSGSGEAELLTFDERVVPSLLAVAPEDTLRIADWPVAPGLRQTVSLTRHDVYSPDARIVMMVGEREVELPRSKLVFFWGSFDSGSVVIAVDPDARVVSGLVMAGNGVQELRAPGGDHPGHHLLGAASALRERGAPPLAWSCAEEELPPAPPSRPAPVAGGMRDAREPLAGRTPLSPFTRYAVVAFDTDNELMLNKFGDNTTTATNYIANLVADMNVIYERDLSLHLQQGYTILRVSTTADPYTVNCGGNACVAGLSEVSNYWGAHYGNVKRMATQLLSGKQSSVWSASGIAWVGGLCSTSYGYSYNQVFNFTQDTSGNDVLITAHELGHNFGSPHTHCYSPVADMCYASEAGCYNGATSCPGVVVYNGHTSNGTLMSYCHLLSCPGGDTLVFHPRTLTEYFNANIAGAGACIFSGSSVPPGPAVSGISPPAGVLAGSTPVTITGAGFVNGATAAFVDLNGSTALASVSFVNSGTLTATTPSHAAGIVDVVVFNPDQTTGTLPNGFTYTSAPPAPAVSSIYPDFGSTAGSTAVTITGTSFVTGATVSIGGSAASSVNVANSTTITATTGAHATGTANVVVTNPDTQTGTLTNGYFYAPPAATSMFYTLAPCRVIDTRNPNGQYGGPALNGSGQRRTFILAGQCSVPSGAKAVSVNVTVTQPAAAGSLTLYPGNGIPTGTSSISFKAGQTRANNAMLFLATDGTGTFGVENDATGTVHFILDVNGYFQ